MAVRHFEAVAADPQADDSLKQMNVALLAAAEGNWENAGETLRELVDKDAENYVVGVFIVCFVLCAMLNAVVGCE